MLLKGVIGAATLNDRASVRDYLREAAAIGARLGGDRNDYWTVFGPTNVAIHRVWASMELGDPIDALERAKLAQMEALPVPLLERRSSHLVTVARAWHARRKDVEAVRVLRVVEHLAPEELRYNGIVREMLRTMLKRERRTIRSELRTLADHAEVLE